MKRGGPLKRKTPLRARSTLPKGSRLRQVSPKRRSQRESRLQVVAASLQRAGYRCEAAGIVAEGFPTQCWGPLDVDEIKGRGVNPGGELDVENTQVLCRGHHTWKHENPARARELGLTKRSWE